MKENLDFTKNTVPAKEQVRSKFRAFIKDNAKAKILFIGNSITLHEEKLEIGWPFCHGMAASCPENDYVHQVVKSIEEQIGDVSFYVVNVGLWEQNYQDEAILDACLSFVDMNPDIVIFRLGENIPKTGLDLDLLNKRINHFLKELSIKTKLLIATDEFWEYEPIDRLLKQNAELMPNGRFVSITDLGYQDENKALGQFAHFGVSIHPNDLGMKRIAERIIVPINEYLKD